MLRSGNSRTGQRQQAPAMADNRRMRLLLIACCLLFTLPLRATAASRESVDRMFSDMGMAHAWDATMMAMKDALDRQFDSAIVDASPTPEQQRRLQASVERLWNLMRSELGWQSLGPEVSQMYAEVFTQEEVDAMLAFYDSEAGRAVLAKTPALAGAAMQDGGDLTHDDVLTPAESAAFDAFMQSPAARSMKAKAALVRQRMSEISRAHRERMRPQMEQIIREMRDPAPGAAR